MTVLHMKSVAWDNENRNKYQTQELQFILNSHTKLLKRFLSFLGKFPKEGGKFPSAGKYWD